MDNGKGRSLGIHVHVGASGFLLNAPLFVIHVPFKSLDSQQFRPHVTFEQI